MKIYLTIALGIFLLMGSNRLYAQTNRGLHPDSIHRTIVPADVYKYSRTNEVIQGSGQTYSGRQIQQMAAKDINQIANTVTGVQYRVGEKVIIRGAADGTAYFVDGVRVYGALPSLTR